MSEPKSNIDCYHMLNCKLKEIALLRQQISDMESGLKAIKNRSEWALETIEQRLSFGFFERDAVYRRERRSKGVFQEIIQETDRLVSLLKNPPSKSMTE